jgi:hypothetical protein
MSCKSDPSRVGDWRSHWVRIAARFFDRSNDTKTFKRGINAYNNPSFYRQLGKDPGDAPHVLAKRSAYLEASQTCRQVAAQTLSFHEASRQRPGKR